MFRRLICAIAIATAIPAIAAAQHAGGGTPRVQSSAPKESAQFAFLIGQWELTVTPKVPSLAAMIHGQPTLMGAWKAWRAFDGFGIEDELRIVDGSGNPNALAHTMRYFDAAQKKWVQSTLDVYRGRFANATGEWKDGAMHVRSEGRDAEGNPYIQRARFYDITPTSFKYQADRSRDGERTWEAGVIRMEARRVAAQAPR